MMLCASSRVWSVFPSMAFQRDYACFIWWWIGFPRTFDERADSSDGEDIHLVFGRVFLPWHFRRIMLALPYSLHWRTWVFMDIKGEGRDLYCFQEQELQILLQLIYKLLKCISALRPTIDSKIFFLKISAKNIGI